MLNYLTVVNLNIEIFNLDCIEPLTFYRKSILCTAVPTLLLFVLSGIYACCTIVKRCRKRAIKCEGRKCERKPAAPTKSPLAISADSSTDEWDQPDQQKAPDKSKGGHGHSKSFVDIMQRRSIRACIIVHLSVSSCSH